MNKEDKHALDDSSLAAQLRCPHGGLGKDIGQLMYDRNKSMILESIDALKIKPKNRILEIGPGNGAHLDYLLDKADALRYFGLEISETMVLEATAFNASQVKERKALFQKYGGCKIEYVRHWFDRILTVNTIYFWEEPNDFLIELYRVLKPRGICVITFVSDEIMQKLPFVNDSFELYNLEKMKSLVLATPFELAFFRKKSEHVKSKNGEMVTRVYIITILKKEPNLI